MRRTAGRLMVSSAVVLVAAAGCTGGGGETDSATDTVTAAPRVDGVSPADLPDVPSLASSVGIAADVEQDGTCDTAAGEQTVQGTVTNSSSAGTDIVISVSWVTATSDVVGRAVTTVEGVDAGDSVPWEATATVAEGAASCTLNAQRGSLDDE